MTVQNNEQTPNNVDPTTAHEAYNALSPAWQKRTSEEVLRPRVGVFAAVGLGLQMARQVQEDQRDILSSLPKMNPEHVHGFRAATLGLWAAETRWRTSRRRANQDDIDAMVETCQDTRRELLAAADYIWRDDDNTKKVIRDTRQGAGQKDLADDLQRLADLFRTRWDEAKGRSEITQEHVESAARLALSLFDEVLRDDQAEALEQRNRAWSHWYEAYTEVYAAGRYIHRHNPAAAQLYPSLSALHSQPRPTEPITETPATEAPSPSPDNGTTEPAPTPVEGDAQ